MTREIRPREGARRPILPGAADAGFPSAWKRALVSGACAAALLLGAAGCVTRARGEIVYGYPVDEVEIVPVEITAYPRVIYRGSYAYLVDGRWYYRGPRGWVVFRQEPQELYRYRTTLPPQDRMRRTAPPPPPRVSPPQERGRRYYPR